MKLTCFVMLKKAKELDIIKIPWTNHHMLSRKNSCDSNWNSRKKPPFPVGFGVLTYNFDT